MRLITASELRHGDCRSVGREVALSHPGLGIHISFDLDAIDPAHVPGTEVPSAGGMTVGDALDLLDGLAEARLAGLDVVELCPPADISDISTLAALKLCFEFMSHLNRQRR